MCSIPISFSLAVLIVFSSPVSSLIASENSSAGGGPKPPTTDAAVPASNSRTDGVPPKSPEEALQEFQTHPELNVQLVASEPQISDPVAIDFGPDGRLWVVQMSDYGHGIEEEFTPTGEVRTLQDRDGDGFYETSTVFADALRYPTDVKVWKDGALICDAPDIIFARDQDGDGRAETKEILFSGFETHNGQARVNSLRWGLDNWLYGSGGLFGGLIANRDGVLVDVSGRDFRIQPELGLIEPVTGRSQQGRVRDDFGNWFGCDNSNLIRHYPVVDHYMQRNPFIVPPLTSLSVDAGKLFPPSDLVLFQLSGAPGRATAACGIEIYRDDALGDSYNNNSFTCEPVNQLVHRQILKRKGATFRGHRAGNEQTSEFLTSTDRWFRPVQARTGPDGGLWVVDMYRYVIEHPKWIPDATLDKLDVFAGQGKGRIYRVVPADHAPKSAPKLSELNNRKLARQIDTGNGSIRDLVHQMLLWRDAADSGEELLRIAHGSQNPAVRIQALAALDGLGQLSEEAILVALGDPDPDVRRQAVRMSEEFLGEPQIAAAVLELAHDQSFAVRIQVAYSLASLTSEKSSQALAKLATESSDPYLRSAALSSLTSVNVGAIAQRILSDKTSRQQLGKPVTATLAGMGNAPAIESALKRILKCEDNWQWWQFDSLAQLLDGLDRRASGGELSVVAPRERTKEYDETAIKTQIEITREQQQSARSIFLAAQERMLDSAITDHQAETALRLLGHPFGPVSKTLVGFPSHAAGSEASLAFTSEIVKLIDLQYSNNRQIAAVHAIGRRGDSNGGKALLTCIDSVTPQVRVALVQTLLAHPAWDSAVHSGLQSGVLHRGDLSNEDRQRFMERQSPQNRVLAKKWLGQGAQSDRGKLVKQWREISNLPADAHQGKSLFDKHCSVCHRFKGVGHEVGPDLAALTSLSTDFLLQAILDPNRDVDARYQNYIALMDDGRVVAGQIVNETASSITLIEKEAKQHVLLRNQLEELRASGKSLMPEGLEESISKQEMAHILAYVQGSDSEAH